MPDTLTTRVHLHRDDYRQTLQLLAVLTCGRDVPGFEPTDAGAFVDWDELAGGWLSSTEKAVVHIARGCATLERAGGTAYLRDQVLTTIGAVA
jgi:hypothetical protein